MPAAGAEVVSAVVTGAALTLVAAAARRVPAHKE